MFLTRKSTRREFVRVQVPATLVGMLALAACAPSAVPTSAPAAPTARPTSAPAARRRIETPRGPVDVPTRAERVLVFDRRGTLGYLLDLGIRPIAAMSAPQIYGGKSFHPLLEADVSGIAAISSTEPDLEQVAGLRPDVIVGNTSDAAMQKAYQQLSAIAPTVAIPIDYSAPEDELTILGHVFGLAEKAASLRSAFKADVTSAAAKARNPGTVSIVLPIGDGVRLYGPNNLVGHIVGGLGGSVVPDLSGMPLDPSGSLTTVSWEQMALISGDTVVILANLSRELRADVDKLLAHPLFQGLPAARANKVIEVESQAVFGTAGLRGQRQVLDQLAKAFA